MPRRTSWVRMDLQPLPTNHSGLVAEDMIMVRIENGTWVLAE